MQRQIINKVKGYQTQDGAGVKLTRVLGLRTSEDYDPILMLDSFDSSNPSDYIKGFPFHPHRGIETISYLRAGAMTHRDHLGNQSTVRDGGVQWMTAGSGIIHEEMPEAAERMLGVQIWLNMKRADKMADPAYYDIPSSEIEEIEFQGGNLRLLAGNYKEHEGFNSSYHPLDFYSLNLEEGGSFKLEVDEDKSLILFTLKGKAEIASEVIEEKTAVLTSKGGYLDIKALDEACEILVLASEEINESIAWGGPIVMNEQSELVQAFDELEKGTFIKVKAK